MMHPEHAAGWTPARLERLAVLWADGKSSRQIVDELGGGLSRNGVIGKAHRLKLPQHPSIKPAKKRVRDPSRLRRHEKRGFCRPLLRRPPEPLTPPLPIPTWNALPGSTPIGILDLSNDTCRWPVGERPFRYCGCEPAEHSVYCDAHHTLATRVTDKGEAL